MNEEEYLDEAPKNRISFSVIAIGIAFAIGTATLTSSILPLTHASTNAAQSVVTTSNSPAITPAVATTTSPKFASGEGSDD